MSASIRILPASAGRPLLVIPADGRGLMVLPDDKGVPMVYLAPDGRAELRDDYDADAAARAFWQAVAAVAPQTVPHRNVVHAEALQGLLDDGFDGVFAPDELAAVREAIRIFGGRTDG